MKLLFALMLLLHFAISTAHAAPSNFYDAKADLKEFVFFDQTESGTLYCGCKWKWSGKTGGIIDLKSCGYMTTSGSERAKRLEWEHIMPAHNFGRSRQCWKHGGRENCTLNDPIFNAMEADMHNLAPSIGEVNADRSNFNYGLVQQSDKHYGSCPFKVDFRNRIAEPRDSVKGQVARVYFYMADRYSIRLSDQQQKLLVVWDKRFPVTAKERQIEARIAARMGHHNEFITGKKRWVLGNHHQEATSLPYPNSINNPFVSELNPTNMDDQIRGNKRSKIYHLASSCPGYSKIANENIVSFTNEASAVNAGYRKALNCK